MENQDILEGIFIPSIFSNYKSTKISAGPQENPHRSTEHLAPLSE